MRRRQFIRRSLMTGLAGLPGVKAVAAVSAPLPRTPRDAEGPFYPVGPRNPTNDLVVGAGREPLLNLGGQLVDTGRQTVAGATIEIWQTDPLGRYKHPRDPNAGERWDDFLYWGEAITATDGEFSFRTYVPGAYSSRPRHIHFKVRRNGETLLTSQMYFSEDDAQAALSRSPDQRRLQTVTLSPVGQTAVNGHIRIVI